MLSPLRVQAIKVLVKLASEADQKTAHMAVALAIRLEKQEAEEKASKR